MSIRRLGPSDRERLKDARLRSLRDAPDAFGSTYAREVAFPDDVWDRRLADGDNAQFAWEAADGRVLGIATFVAERDDRRVGYLVGMWVDSTVRGTGAADRLVDAVCEAARGSGATVLRLHVAGGNLRAERVYERHGFRRTGRSLVRARDGVREHEMELVLDRPAPG
ncbi:MAG TPA: GNAT family N-acetyltransferase [Acidimicrobiia bacterium]|nr:GNAT family N-acetyltransferase [Acidimicrobiia bacterium]